MASISLFTPLVAQTSFIDRLGDIGALRITVVVVVAVLVLWLAYMVIEARVVKVERIEYANTAIPEQFDGMKVLFVADIHAGPYMSRNRMDRLVERINAEEPDVVILGGDYVGGRMKGAQIFYPAIAKVEAARGRLCRHGQPRRLGGRRRSTRRHGRGGYHATRERRR